MRNIVVGCSASSSDYTRTKNLPVRVSDWRWFSVSAAGTAEQFGPNQNWKTARLFISRFRPRRPAEMSIPNAVEILLVEDNPHDAELTLRALRKRKLANSVLHVKDGEEAIHWLFAMGAYADRDTDRKPKLVLLDLKLPKIDGLEVLRQLRTHE